MDVVDNTTAIVFVCIYVCSFDSGPVAATGIDCDSR